MMQHAQELMLWAIADGKMPQWVFLKVQCALWLVLHVVCGDFMVWFRSAQNKSLVDKVVVVLAEGLSASTYARHGSSCPTLASFAHMVPLQFPGHKHGVGDALHSLLQCGLPKRELINRRQNNDNADTNSSRMCRPCAPIDRAY